MICILFCRRILFVWQDMYLFWGSYYLCQYEILVECTIFVFFWWEFKIKLLQSTALSCFPTSSFRFAVVWWTTFTYSCGNQEWNAVWNPGCSTHCNGWLRARLQKNRYSDPSTNRKFSYLHCVLAGSGTLLACYFCLMGTGDELSGAWSYSIHGEIKIIWSSFFTPQYLNMTYWVKHINKATFYVYLMLLEWRMIKI